MAKYRQLIVQDGTGWSLMSPSSPWEALRIAWMLWRYPDRVAALVGVKQEYFLAHTTPTPCSAQRIPCERLTDGYCARCHAEAYP